MDPFFQAIFGDFCKTLETFCTDLIGVFTDLDPSVDNMDRVKTYLSDVPSGAGY